MYFINIFVFLVCIFTGATVYFSVANDKNKTQITLRKRTEFICSLTGKGKNTAGLTPIRLPLFPALRVPFSLFKLSLFSHAIDENFLCMIRKMLTGQPTIYLTATDFKKKETEKSPPSTCQI